jgi:hypothetical protein
VRGKPVHSAILPLAALRWWFRSCVPWVFFDDDTGEPKAYTSALLFLRKESVLMPRDTGFVVLHNQKGNATPGIVCEHCGQIVKDIRSAGVIWVKNTEVEKVKVLCKTNGCLTAGPYRHHPWHEMRHYLLWLLQNSGVKTERQLREEWKSAEEFADIGL